MFTGCGTALVTPFRRDLSLDEATLRKLVQRQIGVEEEGLPRHERLCRRRHSIIEPLDDRLLVDRRVERLANGKLLELRALEVQVEGFERGPRDEGHDAVR